jgi:hypothetical protein
MILRWDSLGAYVRDEVAHVANVNVGMYPASTWAQGRGAGMGEDWDLGISGARAADLAVNGDPSIVAEYAGNVDRYTLDAANETRLAWLPSVSGGRVDMGAYLTGAPDCMRRRARREIQTRHVSIYVSQTCSAGISAATMRKRGAAILGLLDVLNGMQVSVDLYLVIDLDGARSRNDGATLRGRAALANADGSALDGDVTQVVRVESRPLDLSQVGFAIAHPAFSRNIGYRVAAQYGYRGGWSRTWDTCGAYAQGAGLDRYVRIMREKIGADAADLFVPPVSYRDEIISDPARWIRERVTQVTRASAA